MFLMGSSRERALWDAELVGEPVPLVTSLSPARIYLIIISWCLDMKLVGVDSDNRTIFLVHPFDLEGVLPATHHIVIEFVPATNQLLIPKPCNGYSIP